MAMRRPRIKAVANIQLNAKRKPKLTNDVKVTKNSESDNVNGIQKEQKPSDFQTNEGKQDQTTAQEDQNGQNEQEVRMDSESDTNANKNNLINEVEKGNHDKEDGMQNEEGEDLMKGEKDGNKLTEVGEEIKDSFNDSDAFKYPPKVVGYQRTVSHTSNSGADDVFYSDIEENALQMDLQKSPNGFPMSPSKNQTRQRIRQTPNFGQRRNSFVGSSPSHTPSCQDDNQANYNEFAPPSQTPRRERHHSASLSGNASSTSSSHHHFTPHKYLPVGIANGGMGRIRTESGCSVYSDTNTSTHKSRKTEEQNHRQHSRKEFEARFGNGVPDKSALKMSDLIYWNPASNPMEQKPNPNVKLEGTDTSNATTSSDVKPFVEKKEKDSDAPVAATAEAEAVPVPQLKLNSNGELILDDKSLVIETTAEQEARKVLANSSLIYLDENTGMNGFYSRQKRTREWPSSETIKFYRCLQNVGTDFSLMVSLFPNRTRRDLKLKFKKEEKINGHLINKALLYPKQFDIETLKQQVEEEEKAREEEVKQHKLAKEKLKEQKKEVKKKSSGYSVSSRVLKSSEFIYENENVQKPKRAKKVNPNKKKIASAVVTDPTSEQINAGQDNINANTNGIANKRIKLEEGEKGKRRRRRAPNTNPQKDEIVIIKEEIIKKEKKPDTSSLIITTAGPPILYNDVKQLESEMDELLQNNNETLDDTEQSFINRTEAEYEEEEEIEQEGEMINGEEDESSITTDSSHFVIDDNTYYEDDNMDIDHYESRTFVNLDDGSVSAYEITERNYTPTSPYPPPSIPAPLILPPQPTQPRSPSPEILDTQTPVSHETQPPSPPDIINNETCSSAVSELELNEQDIQQILTELAEGSLVLVSTLDPDDPDKVLNEIYMVNKNTGDLCDEPLNIPDNIVQCILSVMS